MLDPFSQSDECHVFRMRGDLGRRAFDWVQQPLAEAALLVVVETVMIEWNEERSFGNNTVYC